MTLLPTPRLSGLLAAWALLGLGASLWGRLLVAWQWAGGGLVGLLALEAAALAWPKPLEATRTCSPSLAVGVWARVMVRLANGSRWPWILTVMDHHPEDFEARSGGQRHRVPATGWLELSYRIRPTRRGEKAFGPVQVRVQGVLGLLQRNLNLEAKQTVKVFPDFAAVARYALLGIDNRLSTLGILRRPRRGLGMDFHQLREYRTGDSLRQVDWKATARVQKLISREYQDERDQQVIFLLDCGRRMRPEEATAARALGHLDQALNALLLLSFVALKQGDAVGVATFAEDEPRLLAPRKGVVALDRMFQQLFDIQPSLRSPDYLEAARSLRTSFRKRSLIILLTNLRDEEEDTLLPALKLLQHKHLVLVANLREAALDQVLATPAATFAETLTQGAALDYHVRREAALRALSRSGARVLDVLPEALPASLVNSYLELKAAGTF